MKRPQHKGVSFGKLSKAICPKPSSARSGSNHQPPPPSLQFTLQPTSSSSEYFVVVQSSGQITNAYRRANIIVHSETTKDSLDGERCSAGFNGASLNATLPHAADLNKCITANNLLLCVNNKQYRRTGRALLCMIYKTAAAYVYLTVTASPSLITYVK